MKLICVRGLVPKVIDTQEWKNFVQAANPRYSRPTSSSTFVESLIPAEAAKARVLQLEQLRTLTRLTLSYDGGSTRKPQSVYTIHITTPNWCVYFMDGLEASEEQHTAEHIKELIHEVMEDVGIERFSGFCSDSAGNTRKARDLLAKDIPGLIDLPDCCHHLQNMVKDITKLTEFKGFISNLRKIVQYFRKSIKASADLTVLRLEEGVARGLQSIGKTRFATVYWSAESLRSCLPLMRQLVSSGKLPISRKRAKFDLALLQENSMTSMRFEQELARYTSIVAPIARAIKSLEATDTTAADVYIFWLGITSTLRDLLGQPEELTGIPPELARKITGIVNRRYKEIINQAPSDVYFSTFFLHPRYARADILARPISVSNAIFVPPRPMLQPRTVPGAAAQGRGRTDKGQDDSEKAPIPRAYRRVKEFLKKLLQAEIKREAHPLLMLYAWGEYPFDGPLPTGKEDGRPILRWWQELEHNKNARVLAMLAIKLYSLAINSMADERTVSTFTWFNSALRSQQTVKTLVDMIQVRQWYLHQDYPDTPPKTHPTVRWADVDKAIFSSREARDETPDDLDEDEFFKDWPSEATVDPREAEREVGLAADVFELDTEVDLSSKTLREMLVDQPEKEKEVEDRQGDDDQDEFADSVARASKEVAGENNARDEPDWGW